MKVTAVILAAGKAKRMGGKKNKIFLKLRKSILGHTLEAFEKNSLVTEIILVANKNDFNDCYRIIKKENFRKIKRIIEGGETRQESSYKGVFSIKTLDNSDVIITHDGARPFVTQDVITNSINDAITHGASVVAVPVKDTIKEAIVNSKDILVKKTLTRDNLWEIQTPQAFKADLIKKAHEYCKKNKIETTDDVTLIEKTGHKVKITKGHYDNLKITTPDDLIIAKYILKKNGY
jgi:2-C-methyl-D-erythritol 4-phosphate cytidylyltransferase